MYKFCSLFVHFWTFTLMYTYLVWQHLTSTFVHKKPPWWPTWLQRIVLYCFYAFSGRYNTSNHLHALLSVVASLIYTLFQWGNQIRMGARSKPVGTIFNKCDNFIFWKELINSCNILGHFTHFCRKFWVVATYAFLYTFQTICTLFFLKKLYISLFFTNGNDPPTITYFWQLHRFHNYIVLVSHSSDIAQPLPKF